MSTSLDKSDEIESRHPSPEREASVAVPLRPVLYFLAGTMSIAIMLELWPLDNVGLWKATPLRAHSSQTETPNSSPAPTYAIYGKSADEEHLIHVKNVLKRLGYSRVGIENDWSLLWAHDYPFFDLSLNLKNLKLHQKVNHWPGCGFITNKVDLSTTHLPFLPRAFRLPLERDEFLSYANNNPNALFVEKHNEHRHIKIRVPSEVNLNATDSFIQEFVQHPFLVDGYKFDIGVYVVITSINPLRVYIYRGDVLFRYCPVKYEPFDSNNVDKYIVGDDYLPTWEVPSLRKYYSTFSGSMRDAFDAYVRDQSLDPSGIWLQVEEIIRSAVLAKEQDIEYILRSYSRRNFFDLIRFDLIIDANLRVWLMEANMSPNLSSAHFKPNALLYEQIIYSALNLVGVGSPVQGIPFSDRSNEMDEMITAEKNVAVNLNDCAENGCDKSCNLNECSLCLSCLSGTEYEILKQTHSEHLHKIDMKRIFPKPMLNLVKFDIEKEVKNMTKRNEWLTRWFWSKCRIDQSWCV